MRHFFPLVFYFYIRKVVNMKHVVHPWLITDAYQFSALNSLGIPKKDIGLNCQEPAGVPGTLYPKKHNEI